VALFISNTHQCLERSFEENGENMSRNSKSHNSNNLYIDPEDGEIVPDQVAETPYTAEEEEQLLTDMIDDGEEDPQELHF
jgi:hypothetical protein